MFQQLLPAFRMMLIMTVLTGLIYPAAITGLCQALFPAKANGSVVSVNGSPVGSALLGQEFTKPGYLHSRPSAAGNGYDGLASGGSNYGPTNQKLSDRVKASIEAVRKENPEYSGPIPADLVTASGSGLDPEISPDSARLQVQRIAKARGVTPNRVERVIGSHVQARQMGILGEPRVNVLETNLALDREFPRR